MNVKSFDFGSEFYKSRIGYSEANLNAFTATIAVRAANGLGGDVDAYLKGVLEEDCPCSTENFVVDINERGADFTNFMRYISWSKRMVFWGPHQGHRGDDPISMPEPNRPQSFGTELWSKIINAKTIIGEVADGRDGDARCINHLMKVREIKSSVRGFLDVLSHGVPEKEYKIHETRLGDWVALSKGRVFDLVDWRYDAGQIRRFGPLSGANQRIESFQVKVIGKAVLGDKYYGCILKGQNELNRGLILEVDRQHHDRSSTKEFCFVYADAQVG